MSDPNSVIYSDKKKNRPPLPRLRQLFRAVLGGLIVLTLLMLAALNQPPALDVSGIWSGQVVQDPGGIFQDYPFQLALNQDGDKITGTSSIHLPDNANQYGIMTVRGYVKDGVIYLNEVTIQEQKLFNEWRWCLKSAELKLDGKTLSGTWTAPGCVPGHMDMTLTAGSDTNG